MRQLLASFCVVAAFFAGSAHAQKYPERPVRVVVPYSPGGATDILARMLAVRLGSALNQTFVVDNKPGAGATIGGRDLVNSAPDGYTIGVFEPNGITVTPHLYRKPPYDSLKDFSPVTRLVDNAQIVVVSSASQFKTFRDVVDYAKKNPGMPYGTSAAVGITMLDFERLCVLAGIKVSNVAYKGSAPLLQDVIGNQIPFAVNDVASVMQHVKSGKIVPLAIASKQRHPAFPDTPTLIELGYAGFESIAWFGVLAPAKTPAAILNTLNTELKKIGESAEFQKWAADQGFTINISQKPEDFTATMKKEIATFSETAVGVRQSHLEPAVACDKDAVHVT